MWIFELSSFRVSNVPNPICRNPRSISRFVVISNVPNTELTIFELHDSKFRCLIVRVFETSLFEFDISDSRFTNYNLRSVSLKPSSVRNYDFPKLECRSVFQFRVSNVRRFEF